MDDYPLDTVQAQSWVQTEQLTDRLRGILNDYPYSIAIFREILQNSDDAGADTQIFVLDRRHFPTEHLFDPALKQYQGPAFLAFNNSIFTDKDWEGLRSLNKSGKVDDITKAGKFGLGFNALYHLTDAPCVLSGNKLGIFDPRQELSCKPGGARLSNVFNEPRLRDQLAAFESLLDGTEPFQSTIVRLPLRVEEGTPRGNTISCVHDADAVKELLVEFLASELSNCLLFLKHLKKLEIREISSEGQVAILAATEIVCPLGKRRPIPINEQLDSYEILEIRTEVGGSRTEPVSWRVLHRVEDHSRTNASFNMKLGPSAGKQLQAEKLFPHVAIASLLVPDRNFRGSLFTFLPLPILTEFPVHVHGLFALMPSRQSLRNSQEKFPKGSREELLVKWNAFLLQDLLPKAWADLLTHVAREDSAGRTSIYSLWPIIHRSERLDWKTLDENLLGLTCHKQSQIWPLYKSASLHSSTAFIALSQGVIASGNSDKHPLKLLKALGAVGIQIIRLPEVMHEFLSRDDFSAKVKKEVTSCRTFMSPEVIRKLLKGSIRLPELGEDQKREILRYVVTDGEYRDLDNLPLFPVGDKDFVAIAGDQAALTAVFVQTSRFEPALFGEQSSRYLNLQRLHPAVKRQITDNLALIASSTILKSLNPDDGAVFATLYINSGACDTLSIAEWLSRFFEWVDDVNPDRVPCPGLDEMCLIPSDSGTLHPVQPPIALLAAKEVRSHVKHLLSSHGVGILHDAFVPSKYLEDRRSICSVYDIMQLLPWLTSVPTELWEDSFTDAVHGLVADSLQKLRQSGRNLPLSSVEELLKLPLVRLSMAGPVNGESNVQYAWGAVGRSTLFVEGMVTVPTGKFSFVDVSQRRNEVFRTELLSTNVKVHGLDQLRFLIKHLPGQPEDILHLIVRESIAPRLFDVRRKAPDLWQELRNIPFIPVQTSRGAFLERPCRVVDPNSSLARIFRSEEGVFATADYMRSDVYKELLRSGLFLSELSKEVVAERVKTFASPGPSGSEVLGLAIELLRQIDNSTLAPFSLLSTQAWLAASSHNAPEALYHGSGCRDRRNKELFSYVVPVVNFEVRREELRECLGWSSPVSLEIIAKQITALSMKSDVECMSRLLESALPLRYFREGCEKLNNVLRTQKWIPLRGQLWQAEHVFLAALDLPGFARLQHAKFNKYEGVFRKAGVQDMPSASAILKMITSLSEGGDIPGCVQLLEALTKADGPSAVDRTEIIAPDADGIFRPIDQLVFDDATIKTTDSVNLCHPTISRALADKWRIPKLSMKFLSDVSGFGEVHEQHQDIVRVVKNTLRDYPFTSTGNEILANADDAKASTVVLMYDMTSPSAECPLFPDLQAVHSGPALIAYNSGEFEDEDIDGLIAVGQGRQKRRGIIGRYGLGALTFFHWTDAPLIVSRETVILLDPSMSYLPRGVGNAARGRPAGMRIDLRKCRDGQIDGLLRPLKGLFGFHPRQTFQGTLIRLPLRRTVKGPLADATPDPDKLFDKVFEDAKLSFFFTRHLQSISAVKRFLDGKERPIFTVTCTRKAIAMAEVSRPHIRNAHIVTLNIAKGDATEAEFSPRGPDVDVMSAQTELWLVTTMSNRKLDHKDEVPTDDSRLTLLENTRQRLNLPLPEVGIAVKLANGKRPVPVEGRVLSTLSLSMKSGFPVHLHGTFALSSDRSAIRQGGDEGRFNDHVLNFAAQAYLWTLGILSLNFTANVALWPTPVDQASPCAALTTAIYGDAFVHTIEPVLRCLAGPTQPPRAVAPKECILSEFSFIVPFLQLLTTSRFASVMHISRHLPVLTRTTLAFDDPARVRDIVLEADTKLCTLRPISDVTVQRLCAVIRHLVRANSPPDDVTVVIGLRLLPTQDDKFQVFRRASSGQFFFAVSSQESTLFCHARHRFLADLDPNILDLLVLDSKLNVRKMTASDVAEVVGLVHQQGPMRPLRVCNGEESSSEWLLSFWRYVVQSGFDPKSFNHLPLLLLEHPTSHVVSADEARRKFAVYLPADEELACVVKALPDFIVFHRALPSQLAANIAESRIFDLAVFLDWLLRHPNGWDTLEEPNKHVLYRWLRLAIANGRELPISRLGDCPMWETRRSNHAATILRAAPQIVVLPSTTSFADLRRFLAPRHFFYTPVMNESNGAHLEILRQFGATFVNNAHGLHSLDNYMEIPAIIQSDQDVTAYDATVTALLQGSRSGALQNQRLLPSQTRVLTLPRELYNPGIELFAATFDPSRLLHPSFVRHIPQLGFHGFNDTVTPARFIECARVISTRWISNDVLNNARIMYSFLSAEGMYFASYQAIEDLRFIPAGAPANSLGWRQRSAYRHDAVLTPGNLALERWWRVCWTQRAQFEIQPSARLVAAWTGLGVPTCREVVHHLVMLSQTVYEEMDRQDASIRTQFVEDLMAAYQFLADRVEDATPALVACSSAIFLNIHSSDERDWIWLKANQIILGVDYKTSRLSPVRRFLQKFEGLLQAAGAVSVQGVDMNELPTAETADNLSYKDLLLNGLLTQATTGELTDVSLRAHDGTLLRAHKAVLAATNSYFRALFSGDWQDRDEYDVPVSGPVLRAIRGFFYGDVEEEYHVSPEDTDRAGEVLDELLELLAAADEREMLELKQRTADRIIDRRLDLVRPETVEIILEHAERLNVANLIRYCQLFIEKNRALLDEVKECGDEDELAIKVGEGEEAPDAFEDETSVT